MARLSGAHLEVSQLADLHSMKVYVARGSDDTVYSVGVVSSDNYERIKNNTLKLGDKTNFYGPAISGIMTLRGVADELASEFPLITVPGVAVGGPFRDLRTREVAYGLSYAKDVSGSPKPRRALYDGRDSGSSKSKWADMLEQFRTQEDDTLELAILKTILPSLAER